MRKRKKAGEAASVSPSAAYLDFVLDASEDQLDEALVENGVDPAAFLESAQLAMDRALARAAAGSEVERTLASPERTLRAGLAKMLSLLLRRDALSPRNLASAVDVDESELESMASDPGFHPSLRTVKKLEDYFELPPRVLGVLAGFYKTSSPAVQEHALRFAANSGEKIGRLSRDEQEALNTLIEILAEHTDGEDVS